MSWIKGHTGVKGLSFKGHTGVLGFPVKGRKFASNGGLRGSIGIRRRFLGSSLGFRVLVFYADFSETAVPGT